MTPMEIKKWLDRIDRDQLSTGEYAAVTEAAEIMERVQEVIAKHAALTQCVRGSRMTKLMELWRDFSSQEMFGESLREEDPETFDELDAAITQNDKREQLVQEVLERYNALTACALNGQSSCENEDAALFEALRQLQDWSEP